MRVLIVLALLVAGCVEPTTPPPTTASEPGPLTLTLYLEPGGELSELTPEASRMTIDWGYMQWLDGTPPPAWVGPAGPMRVLAGNITLHYEANQATLSGDVRPELTAWWGTDESIVHHVFIDGADTLAPGDRIEAHSELRIPEGGLVISPDNQMLLRIGSYYADGPQFDVMDLLMGGEHASRLELLVEPLQWPATTGQVVLEEVASLTGGRCTVPLNADGSADAIFTVDVPEDAIGLTVAVEAVSTEPTGDLDLIVTGPGGEDVGGGHSSFNEEGAGVWWPNLEVAGPGAYTLHVFACTPQAGDFRIEATLWT